MQLKHSVLQYISEIYIQ